MMIHVHPNIRHNNDHNRHDDNDNYRNLNKEKNTHLCLPELVLNHIENFWYLYNFDTNVCVNSKELRNDILKWVCLSICLYVHLSICLCVYLSVTPSQNVDRHLVVNIIVFVTTIVVY